MKKGILTVLALVLVFSVSAFGAKKMVEVDDGSPSVVLNNCFSTNIYPWFVVWINASYERMLGDSISIKIGASNIGNMFGLGASILFHPQGKGLDGFFVGPKYDAWIAESGTMNWIGGIFGYNFLINDVAVFGLGVGVQLNAAGPLIESGGITFGDKWPTVETSIGWAF